MKTSLHLAQRSLLSLTLLLAVATTRAADTVKYASKFGSSVKIDGTSNIHDWTVKGQIIKGSMEAAAAFDKDLKTLTPIPKVEVSIPVRSLKSNNGKMDEVMQEHMKMKDFPEIKYTLTKMTAKGDPKGPNGPAEFDTTGDLTVSGAKKSIDMPVTIERVDGGKLKVIGTIALKMTNFKISPPAPTIALGLIKTGDDVKLVIEWIIGADTTVAAK